MESQDTGLLLNKEDIELQRGYFKEMCRLLGINVVYKAPRPQSKDYDLHGELDTKYMEPTIVSCIFNEHPNQWTMKKLGWVSELQEAVSLISVPYDLPGLESGALFIIPSGIDHSKGRVFKVLRMSTIMVYPASITCELGPVFEDEVEASSTKDFTKTDFNLLNAGDAQ